MFGPDESNVLWLTNMQIYGAHQRLGLAGGKAPPLYHFLMAEVVHLRAVKKTSVCGVKQEERSVHSSYAGQTRHTSGEYVQCIFFFLSKQGVYTELCGKMISGKLKCVLFMMTNVFT